MKNVFDAWKDKVTKDFQGTNLKDSLQWTLKLPPWNIKKRKNERKKFRRRTRLLMSQSGEIYREKEMHGLGAE